MIGTGIQETFYKSIFRSKLSLMLLSCVADTFIAVPNCHFPSFIFFSPSQVMDRGFTVF